ncbi:GNAT family N-acetyltransferase [Oceanobacillus arenosus]|uniref:GNAT family N-acetyltransferase n=1 Tax=Oceanobacillus arenosus TaxID=1229153 RepID=A0A3D8PX54_9BACI|nr:GNAT family N-acetyltransferase [Oceanobacillus arenosus]RDW20352.1 GNAT family N-acetyltransferase [Oceanobacillus arenosus]
MRIRKFQSSDINQIVSLFQETVHAVNAADYSIEQLNAWAPIDEIEIKLKNWSESLSNNISYVAEMNDKIVGFSDMDYNGHLDRLYIHKDFQKQGIAAALVHMLESRAKEMGLSEMDTEASITAKHFFERHGYRVIRSQIVERRNISLINYRMIKQLVSE